MLLRLSSLVPSLVRLSESITETVTVAVLAENLIIVGLSTTGVWLNVTVFYS